MWDNDKVKIIPIKEMEGLQFGVHYFDDKSEFFVSPSILEKLKMGKLTELKFVMLSWEKPGRNIQNDMKNIVDKFKDMPSGQISFDVNERENSYKSNLTGKRRVIVSPHVE